MNKRIVAILQASGVLILMSMGTILTKIVLADVPPFTYAWTSIGVGMIIMSLYTFLVKKERVPRQLGKRVWWYIVAIGVCNFTISRLTRPLAIARLPVITNSYVGNFIGFFTMAMSIFILKEYPSIFQLLGAGIAVYGITLYFNQPLQGGELIGILFILAGILAVAYTNNIARKLAIVTKNELSNNIISTVALLIGGVGAVLAGLIFDFPPKVPDLQSWVIIFYSGLINIALGLTVWNHILRTLRSYEASILGASTIIWITLLAMLILGENPTLFQWLGMATMVIGLLLVQVRKGRLDQLIKKRTNPAPMIGDPIIGQDTKDESICAKEVL